MRIIFLSIEFSIGTFSGNGIYAISQVRALRQLGHQVLVICGRPATTSSSASTATAKDDLLSVPLPIWNRLDLECSWKEYSLGCGAPHIVNAAINFNADAVLGVDWHSYLAYQNLKDALEAEENFDSFRTPTGYKIPPYACSNYRVFLRSLSDTDQNVELMGKLEGGSLLQGICSTVLSASDKKFVEENYSINLQKAPQISPEPTLHVILPALRADLAALPLPQSTERKFLLCCVRASPEKEPHRFVNLICELQRRDFFSKHGIVPLIAGAGWKVDVEKEVKQQQLPIFSSSIEKYVFDLRQQIATHVPCCEIIETFLGPVQMADIYSQSVLNIHPPIADAFGMTICEAASQSAPSLVAWHGHVGATDLLNPDRNEIFVTDMEDSIENIATVVENLVKNREKLKIVGETAAAVVRKWNEEANAAAVVQVLEDALANYVNLQQNNQQKPVVVLSDSPLEENIKLISKKTTRRGIDVLQPSFKNDTSSSLKDNNTRIMYKYFEENYLAANKPVILSGIATHWLATKEWRDATTGGIQIENLERKFGEFKVVATDTARRHRGEGSCKEMSVAKYCQWWKERKYHLDKDSGPSNGSGGGGGKEREQGKEEQEHPLWYLKDWHFVKDASSSSQQQNKEEGSTTEYYQLPIYFFDDWLNEWYDSLTTTTTATNTTTTTLDYRFLYLGPQGSSTPLHTDVLRSHSWSANITGRKLWRLLPAEYACLVQDSSTGMNHPYDFYPEEDTANTRFPGLKQAQQHHIMEIVQYPSEILFVPSGWYHTVQNLDDCLSINHNWISSHSVMNSWRYLQKERVRAETLIEDCREMNGVAEFEFLVQRNVEMNAGVGYSKFGAMVRYIAIKAVKKGLENRENGGDDLGLQRVAVAKEILKEMLEEQEKVIFSSSSSGSCRDTEEEMDAREALLIEIRLNKECLDELIDFI